MIFSCEIDGLFENLLTEFLISEPKRMNPYLATFNELIKTFESEIVDLKTDQKELAGNFSSKDKC